MTLFLGVTLPDELRFNGATLLVGVAAGVVLYNLAAPAGGPAPAGGGAGGSPRGPRWWDLLVAALTGAAVGAAVGGPAGGATGALAGVFAAPVTDVMAAALQTEWGADAVTARVAHGVARHLGGHPGDPAAAAAGRAAVVRLAEAFVQFPGWLTPRVDLAAAAVAADVAAAAGVDLTGWLPELTHLLGEAAWDLWEVPVDGLSVRAAPLVGALAGAAAGVWSLETALTVGWAGLTHSSFDAVGVGLATPAGADVAARVVGEAVLDYLLVEGYPPEEAARLAAEVGDRAAARLGWALEWSHTLDGAARLAARATYELPRPDAEQALTEGYRRAFAEVLRGWW